MAGGQSDHTLKMIAGFVTSPIRLIAEVVGLSLTAAPDMFAIALRGGLSTE
jgi:hypothetical protein